MAYYRFPPTNILTSGLATEAKQDAAITLLTDIEADTTAILADTAAIDISTTSIDDNTTPLDVVDQLDDGVLDASSTNITASSGVPVTVVASLAADVRAIVPDDTTGYFLGLYSDPAGTPVLEAIIGPGGDKMIPVQLTAGMVLGLRHMSNTAITVGEISINFLGV